MMTLVDMKRRRYTWLALLVAAALALIVGYSSSVRSARHERIIIGRDVSDTAGIASAKAGYDPYFNQVNYFGTIVPSSTNPIARNR
jgi:hypothetical protein